MKLVENKAWEYFQEHGIDGMYKAVRDAAAICYQTDVEKMKMSPKEFVENVLLKNGHTRPLEFGTVYLKIEGDNIFSSVMTARNQSGINYMGNPFSKVNFDNSTYKTTYHVTTNLRVIMQGDYETDEEAFEHGYDKNWLDDLKYWCEPTERHYKRRTFSMWMSRGCTDDSRTHIKLSSICESTRFCNYSKNKFGNELTFIKPYWIEQDIIDAYENGEYVKFLLNNQRDLDRCAKMDFLKSMEAEEKEYLSMAQYHLGYHNPEIKDMSVPLQPQQLKRLFPLGVKAELRLCGFEDAWKNFFWRRSDDHADPECKIVSDIIKDKLW